MYRSRLLSISRTRIVTPELGLLELKYLEALPLIVMTVTAVTLPIPMGFLRDGPYPERSWPSFHRHVERHRRNGLGKQLSGRYDVDESRDGLSQLYSNRVTIRSGASDLRFQGKDEGAKWVVAKLICDPDLVPIAVGS